MGNQNVISQREEKKLMKLVGAYIDNGAPARVIAAECNVNWGLFQHYMDGTSNKRMLVKTAKNLTEWLNTHSKYKPKDVKRCRNCGKIKPLSEFDADARTKDGKRTVCATCVKVLSATAKAVSDDVKKKGDDMSNNNTEVAITAELVKKVKAEDNPDVSSVMLAPYFGITPKQLDAIRNGEWDSILYKKEQPKPATDVKNAVEALRVEIADMHSLLNRLMVEMGVSTAVTSAGRAERAASIFGCWRLFFLV